MKKLGVMVLVILVILPIVNSLGERMEAREFSDTKFQELSPSNQALSQQLETQIQSSINTGSTVNHASPEYRDNPDVV